jgi:hypothetical protein
MNWILAPFRAPKKEMFVPPPPKPQSSRKKSKQRHIEKMKSLYGIGNLKYDDDQDEYKDEYKDELKDESDEEQIELHKWASGLSFDDKDMEYSDWIEQGLIM